MKQEPERLRSSRLSLLGNIAQHKFQIAGRVNVEGAEVILDAIHIKHGAPESRFHLHIGQQYIIEVKGAGSERVIARVDAGEVLNNNFFAIVNNDR